ncbi:enhancer of rudimentary erh [Anaeramoeba flamelloides]|uniref:Enhancer of rudimentary erh n=1 Tax=Anaeramoeba flamelloides TaxID=1746091 RepID=A0AAV8ACV3_9EUKA|nr:enhancer of rudimentary erh [Anaeramoeba flamelloides]
MSQKQKHTIVLIQDTDYRNSRTYYDYPTITAAMNGISSIFEHKLTEKTRKRNHKHDINEIYNFIDNLTDISCLM